MRIGLVIWGGLALTASLAAQADDPGVASVAALPAQADERIFGVIPGYQFVETPNSKLPALSAKEKFALFVKETADPFTIFGAAMGAAHSQIAQGDPVYGQGARAFRQRLGAAYADVATQNFFSDSLFATLFKEDPRYFRLGPGSSVVKRVGYSLSRVAICRTDAGKDGICYSSLLGTMMGIALSNAYYPAADQTGKETLSRMETSFSSAALSNLLPEFWPDIKQKLFRPKKRKP